VLTYAYSVKKQFIMCVAVKDLIKYDLQQQKILSILDTKNGMPESPDIPVGS
jgi:hypothetical protein